MMHVVNHFRLFVWDIQCTVHSLAEYLDCIMPNLLKLQIFANLSVRRVSEKYLKSVRLRHVQHPFPHAIMQKTRFSANNLHTNTKLGPCTTAFVSEQHSPQWRIHRNCCPYLNTKD